MKISVVDPVGAAISRTKRVLFQPFEIGKWFVLGFCAFLAYLGESGGGGGGIPTGPGGGGGGGGGGGTGSGPGTGGGLPPEVQQAIDWVRVNLGTVIVIALIGTLVVLGLTLLLLWVRSRGKFMFIDGVVRNRGAVVEPWKTYKAHGNSLCLFTFALSILGMVVFLGIALLGAWIAWPDIQAGEFSSAAITSIVVSGVLLLAMMLGFGIVSVLLEDFVVPTMYLHDLPVMTAWSVVGTIVSGRVGTIVLYFLMKIVLSIAIGIIATVATCATCCVVAIPYLGTVILLPLFVFIRCYSLCFLQQLGDDWRFFEPEVVPPPLV